MARKRSIRRSTKKQKSFLAALVPESFQAFIARRMVDIVSSLLCIFGFLTLLALISYNPADPSWNTAIPENQNIEQTIHNWGGISGAWLADLLAQTIGLAGGLLGGVLLIWGIRLFSRQSLRPIWARSSALALGCVSASIALAVVPAHGWLVTQSMGSTFGELMYGGISGWSIMITNAPAFYVITLPAAILSLISIAYATGLTLSESMKGLIAAKTFIAISFITTAKAVSNFYNWLRHYNDDAYKSDGLNFSGIIASLQSLRPEKTMRTAPPIASSPNSSFSTDTPSPVSHEAPKTPTAGFAEQRMPKTMNIPVVTTQKSSKQSAPVATQSRFPLSDGEWEAPPISLLQSPPQEVIPESLSEEALRKNAELLQNVLADFNVDGEITSIHPGPVVTLYELEPAPGTKTSRVISIADDIARSMSAVSVRCAVVPGRNVIGIELPNKTRQTVHMQELLASRLFEKTSAHLPLILGKDIGGQPILADLAKMPHLLVAGTTGSGKSVAVNTMILSLLYRLPPEKCRFIMIDPKMLELSVYDSIPHLLSPVVTDPGKAVVALKWTVHEMEERYRSMSKLGVRNIQGYNKRLAEARKNGETIMNKVQTGFDPETGQPTHEEQAMDLTELPHIVVIVDEFADLMLVAGKDVENAIQRLAQMARAAGIHIIMATQRPSVDVITGVIKANFPTRISFQVTSKIDSRTILGEGGAEQLLGMGDMLYMAPGGRITRVHGPFVSDKDVEQVTNYLRAQGEPNYIDSIADGDGVGDDSAVMAAMFGSGDTKENSVDELYDKAVAIIAREGKASTSFIQRHLQIGYNRAARIIEEMERQGVISKASPTGKREILVRDFSDV